MAQTEVPLANLSSAPDIDPGCVVEARQGSGTVCSSFGRAGPLGPPQGSQWLSIERGAPSGRALPIGEMYHYPRQRGVVRVPKIADQSFFVALNL